MRAGRREHAVAADRVDAGLGDGYEEAGHADQNVYLPAMPLALDTVLVGAFNDHVVREVLARPYVDRHDDLRAQVERL